MADAFSANAIHSFSNNFEETQRNLSPQILCLLSSTSLVHATLDKTAILLLSCGDISSINKSSPFFTILLRLVYRPPKLILVAVLEDCTVTQPSAFVYFNLNNELTLLNLLFSCTVSMPFWPGMDLLGAVSFDTAPSGG